jgi:hypothetical protein
MNVCGLFEGSTMNHCSLVSADDRGILSGMGYIQFLKVTSILRTQKIIGYPVLI